MQEIRAVVSRHLIVGLLFFLPRSRRIAIERSLRGKEEYRKLQHADWVLMSWGKSGRTWFRVMLSRFYQIKHGLPVNRLLEFDNLHRMQPLVPRVLFSHNNYMRDYLKEWDKLDHFRGKKVVLLVRDPRDVAVSKELDSIRQAGLYKEERHILTPQGADIGVAYPPGSPRKEVVNFCANNYLGLSSHPDVIRAAREGLDSHGYGMSSVRFICGTQDIHRALEKKIAEFGKRAQDGKLGIEELSGGTFSISNGGVFGSMLSTPIINPPQSAILGVHATKERPVVENGQIVVRPMNYLALSYDHRIVDGREAVLFLVAIKDALEDPARLVLEI